MHNLLCRRAFETLTDPGLSTLHFQPPGQEGSSFRQSLLSRPNYRMRSCTLRAASKGRRSASYLVYRSFQPFPSKIFRLLFSIRAILVFDCFADEKCIRYPRCRPGVSAENAASKSGFSANI